MVNIKRIQVRPVSKGEVIVWIEGLNETGRYVGLVSDPVALLDVSKQVGFMVADYDNKRMAEDKSIPF
jgi:hypothetical protein